MGEKEDMGRRLYEACLSGSVASLHALLENDQLILDRVNSFTYFLNDTPLHIAALRGHLDLTKALLTRKEKLASELDSLRCSPLHLASIEGHVEIVKELLLVNTNVCLVRDQDDSLRCSPLHLASTEGHVEIVKELLWVNTNVYLARDQDGRIPLHLAAIKGRVEVIRELLQAKPESIREKLDRGETVLHLCVKYNKLEALKTLIEDLRGNEFLLSFGDDNGNTILHIAAALKQMDTIKYLLGIKNVKERCTNVKNRNGSTALDVVEHCPNRDLKTMEVREFLLHAGVRRSIYDGSDLNSESPFNDSNPPRPCYCGKDVVKVIVQYIARCWTRYFAVDPLWLKEVRGHLITAATLTATMAYQAILSPPGGFWQDTNDNHIAGQAVLDDGESDAFLGLNSVVLFASLCTIMLALSGFSHHNKFLLWLMIFTVYVTLSCMAVSYDLAAISLFPSQMENNGLFNVFSGVLYALVGVIGFVVVLHTCHFLVWLGKKIAYLVKLCLSGGRRRCFTCIPNYC